jgi:hypothetical protein
MTVVRIEPPDVIDSVLKSPGRTAKVLDALLREGWVFVHKDDIPKGEVVDLELVRQQRAKGKHEA